MGSKSPEYEVYRHYKNTSDHEKPSNVDGKSRNSHVANCGNGCLDEKDGGGDNEDDDDDKEDTISDNTHLGPLKDGLPIGVCETSEIRKKPRKKPKKKGTNKTAQLPLKQSLPPRVLLSDLFPQDDYPQGEIQNYSAADQTKTRITNAESRHDNQRQWNDEVFLKDYRKAAEAHRQARAWVQETVKPGQNLLSIAEGIEDSVRAMLGHTGIEAGDSLKAGLGFPTGISLNNQVAHYTPNPGQQHVVLQQEDVIKVDFGVHINGWIVDSAFTMTFDPVYDNLLAAVKEATNEGIKATGIDVRICDVSAAIQEIMQSYEVEIRGKTFPVKPVRNITAHDIKQYQIHGGKSIPFVKNSDQTKMEEGEIFAIETFGTTGRGYVHDDTGVYGYKLNRDAPLNIPVPLTSAKRLHKIIRENFGTLVFCRRYLERLGVERYLAGLNCLVSNGIVEVYEPLADIKGSYSAQFEHTLLLLETHKEVFSRGDDY